MRNDGKAENFELWKYKFKLFMEDEDEQFLILMNQVERSKEEDITPENWAHFKINNNIVKDTVVSDDDWEWINKQLYNTLFLNCDGTPVDQLRNLTERDPNDRNNAWGDVRGGLRGLLGWNIICRSGWGLTGKECKP